tara:strand:- start:833 stop:1051 length:219 start_codon:yes stop_codon:yes gene_type:complete
MCVGAMNQATSQIRSTRDNVNSLFGWGNTETRGEGQKLPSSVTNIYNYGKETTKTPNRASLNTKGNSKGGTY